MSYPTPLLATDLSLTAFCYDALGLQLPPDSICLLTECKNQFNGRGMPPSHREACTQYGLQGINPLNETVKAIKASPGEFAQCNSQACMNYLHEDQAVISPAGLDPRQFPKQAPLRGSYLQAVHKMAQNGLPVDARMLSVYNNTDHGDLRLAIAEGCNAHYQCQLFQGGRFDLDAFRGFIYSKGLLWPSSKDGTLDLSDDTFKAQAKASLGLAPLWQVKQTLEHNYIRPIRLDPDGRHRYDPHPFGSSTGRDQPKGDCIFVGPTWRRGFISAHPGTALVVVDYNAQETMIAASLSEDQEMIADYEDGDFYWNFAVRCGEIPRGLERGQDPDVDKKRDVYKQVALGIQYGMGKSSMADKLGVSPQEALRLINQHKNAYPGYWSWREAVDRKISKEEPMGTVMRTMLNPPYHSRTSFNESNPTRLSALNFPIQATGSDILHLSVIVLTESGFKVCATLHDCVIVEIPADDASTSPGEIESIMTEASEFVLGYPVRVETKLIQEGQRFFSKRGQFPFSIVAGALGKCG